MMPAYSIAQKKAFETFDSDLCVLAGAGSGKTSVLVERFLRAVTEKHLDPENILAITFTEKAANQMRSRLVKVCSERGLFDVRRRIDNAPIATIHGFCARLLKENPIEAGLDPFFRVLSESEAEILAMKALDRLFEEESESALWMRVLSDIGEDAARDTVRKLHDLYRATGGDDSIFRVSGSPEGIKRKEEVARVTRRFQEMHDAQKRALAAYDFDDLLFLAYKLLSEKKTANQALRRRCQARFKLILVDEYQDVSPLQDELIGLLKSRDNLFIVGDIQQSIYGFRHADPEVFRARGQAAAQIILNENYRARPEVLEFVNAFFAGMFPKKDFLTLEAKRVFKEKPVSAPVELLCLAKGEKEEAQSLDSLRIQEARSVAAWIERLVASGKARYGDVAVLFRAAGPARFYEKELAERGIPYETVRGRGFYEKPEIADLVNLLRLVENPEEDIALAGVLRSPLVALSDDALYWLAKRAKSADSEAPLLRGLESASLVPELSEEDRAKASAFERLLETLRKEKETLKIGGILRRALAETGYEAKILLWPDGLRRAANVRKFVDMASLFEGSGAVGVGDFVRFVGALSERERPEPEARLESASRDAVLLSTIHAVKGLEFPVVVVADMGARLQAKPRGPFAAMPGLGIGEKEDEIYKKINESLSASEAAEDSRLLYVAMTRAKEKLLLAGALTKRSWMERVAKFKEIPIADLSASPEKKENSKEKPKEEWPAGFAEALQSRLNTQFRSYEETADATVTEVLKSWNAEPAEKLVFEEEKILEEMDEDTTLAANEYGTLFHRLMEHLAHKKPAKLSKTGFFARLTRALSPAESKRLWDEASGFWAGPWGQVVRKARKLYPELPFIYKTPRGLLKGQIDLVIQTQEGRWVILDYKTGAGTAEAYRFQLELYALIFFKLYGELPAKGVLYYSAEGKGVEFNLDRSILQKTEEKLALIFKDSFARMSPS